MPVPPGRRRHRDPIRGAARAGPTNSARSSTPIGPSSTSVPITRLCGRDPSRCAHDATFEARTASCVYATGKLAEADAEHRGRPVDRECHRPDVGATRPAGRDRVPGALRHAGRRRPGPGYVTIHEDKRSSRSPRCGAGLELREDEQEHDDRDASHAPRVPETTTPSGGQEGDRAAEDRSRLRPSAGTSYRPKTRAGSRTAANWAGFWFWMAAARAPARSPARHRTGSRSGRSPWRRGCRPRGSAGRSRVVARQSRRRGPR